MAFAGLVCRAHPQTGGTRGLELRTPSFIGFTSMTWEGWKRRKATDGGGTFLSYLLAAVAAAASEFLSS